MTSSFFSRIALITLTLPFLACSKGFKSADSHNSSSSNGDLNCIDGSCFESPQTWDELGLQSSITGGPADNQLVVDIDPVTKRLILRLPIPINPFIIAGAQGTLPGIPKGEFKLVAENNGGWSLYFYIPLAKVLDGIDSQAPSKLPNGDPLPTIPDGELPKLAFNIPQQNKIKPYLYLGPSAAAVFLETPLDPFLYLQFPIRNQAKTRILGYFVLIPKKGEHNGGFFISFIMPADIARAIDNLI